MNAFPATTLSLTLNSSLPVARAEGPWQQDCEDKPSISYLVEETPNRSCFSLFTVTVVACQVGVSVGGT